MTALFSSKACSTPSTKEHWHRLQLLVQNTSSFNIATQYEALENVAWGTQDDAIHKPQEQGHPSEEMVISASRQSCEAQLKPHEFFINVKGMAYLY